MDIEAGTDYSQKFRKLLASTRTAHDVKIIYHFLGNSPLFAPFVTCNDIKNLNRILEISRPVREEMSIETFECMRCVLRCSHTMLNTNPQDWMDPQIRKQYGAHVLKVVSAITKVASRKNYYPHFCVLLQYFLKIVCNLSNLHSKLKDELVRQLTFPFMTLSMTDALHHSIQFNILKTLNALLEKSDKSLRIMIATTFKETICQLARRLAICGDYEWQTTIIETIYRLKRDRKFLYEIALCVSNETYLQNSLATIDTTEFDLSIRNFLNEFNNSLGKDQKVFSVVCYRIFIGESELFKPCDAHNMELWLDFNLSSGRISFYTDDVTSESTQGSNAPQEWEIFNIFSETVQMATLRDKGEKMYCELYMELNPDAQIKDQNPDLGIPQDYLSVPKQIDARCLGQNALFLIRKDSQLLPTLQKYVLQEMLGSCYKGFQSLRTSNFKQANLNNSKFREERRILSLSAVDNPNLTLSQQSHQETYSCAMTESSQGSSKRKVSTNIVTLPIERPLANRSSSPCQKSPFGYNPLEFTTVHSQLKKTPPTSKISEEKCKTWNPFANYNSDNEINKALSIFGSTNENNSSFKTPEMVTKPAKKRTPFIEQILHSSQECLDQVSCKDSVLPEERGNEVPSTKVVKTSEKVTTHDEVGHISSNNEQSNFDRNSNDVALKTLTSDSTDEFYQCSGMHILSASTVHRGPVVGNIADSGTSSVTSAVTVHRSPVIYGKIRRSVTSPVMSAASVHRSPAVCKVFEEQSAAINMQSPQLISGVYKKVSPEIPERFTNTLMLEPISSVVSQPKQNEMKITSIFPFYDTLPLNSGSSYQNDKSGKFCSEAAGDSKQNSKDIQEKSTNLIIKINADNAIYQEGSCESLNSEIIPSSLQWHSVNSLKKPQLQNIYEKQTHTHTEFVIENNNIHSESASQCIELRKGKPLKKRYVKDSTLVVGSKLHTEEQKANVGMKQSVSSPHEDEKCDEALKDAMMDKSTIPAPLSMVITKQPPSMDTVVSVGLTTLSEGIATDSEKSSFYFSLKKNMPHVENKSAPIKNVHSTAASSKSSEIQKLSLDKYAVNSDLMVEYSSNGRDNSVEVKSCKNSKQLTSSDRSVSSCTLLSESASDHGIAKGKKMCKKNIVKSPIVRSKFKAAKVTKMNKPKLDHKTQKEDSDKNSSHKASTNKENVCPKNQQGTKNNNIVEEHKVLKIKADLKTQKLCENVKNINDEKREVVVKAGPKTRKLCENVKNAVNQKKLNKINVNSRTQKQINDENAHQSNEIDNAVDYIYKAPTTQENMACENTMQSANNTIEIPMAPNSTLDTDILNEHEADAVDQVSDTKRKEVEDLASLSKITDDTRPEVNQGVNPEVLKSKMIEFIKSIDKNKVNKSSSLQDSTRGKKGKSDTQKKMTKIERKTSGRGSAKRRLFTRDDEVTHLDVPLEDSDRSVVKVPPVKRNSRVFKRTKNCDSTVTNKITETDRSWAKNFSQPLFPESTKKKGPLELDSSDEFDALLKMASYSHKYVLPKESDSHIYLDSDSSFDDITDNKSRRLSKGKISARSDIISIESESGLEKDLIIPKKVQKTVQSPTAKKLHARKNKMSRKQQPAAKKTVRSSNKRGKQVAMSHSLQAVALNESFPDLVVEVVPSKQLMPPKRKHIKEGSEHPRKIPYLQETTKCILDYTDEPSASETLSKQEESAEARDKTFVSQISFDEKVELMRTATISDDDNVMEVELPTAVNQPCLGRRKTLTRDDKLVQKSALLQTEVSMEPPIKKLHGEALKQTSITHNFEKSPVLLKHSKLKKKQAFPKIKPLDTKNDNLDLHHINYAVDANNGIRDSNQPFSEDLAAMYEKSDHFPNEEMNENSSFLNYNSDNSLLVQAPIDNNHTEKKANEEVHQIKDVYPNDTSCLSVHKAHPRHVKRTTNVNSHSIHSTSEANQRRDCELVLINSMFDLPNIKSSHTGSAHNSEKNNSSLSNSSESKDDNFDICPKEQCTMEQNKIHSNAESLSSQSATTYLTPTFGLSVGSNKQTRRSVSTDKFEKRDLTIIASETCNNKNICTKLNPSDGKESKKHCKQNKHNLQPLQEMQGNINHDANSDNLTNIDCNVLNKGQDPKISQDLQKSINSTKFNDICHNSDSRIDMCMLAFEHMFQGESNRKMSHTGSPQGSADSDLNKNDSFNSNDNISRSQVHSETLGHLFENKSGQKQQCDAKVWWEDASEPVTKKKQVKEGFAARHSTPLVGNLEEMVANFSPITFSDDNKENKNITYFENTPVNKHKAHKMGYEYSDQDDSLSVVEELNTNTPVTLRMPMEDVSSVSPALGKTITRPKQQQNLLFTAAEVSEDDSLTNDEPFSTHMFPASTINPIQALYKKQFTQKHKANLNFAKTLRKVVLGHFNEQAAAFLDERKKLTTAATSDIVSQLKILDKLKNEAVVTDRRIDKLFEELLQAFQQRLKLTAEIKSHMDNVSHSAKKLVEMDTSLLQDHRAAYQEASNKIKKYLHQLIAKQSEKEKCMATKHMLANVAATLH